MSRTPAPEPDPRPPVARSCDGPPISDAERAVPDAVRDLIYGQAEVVVHS